ncbi:MAG: DUF2341 domain-containing protein, partial [Promethearchaeota archaeon]
MTINKKGFRRKLNRNKSLGFLLIIIIILMNFNSTLFAMFDIKSEKTNDNVYSERTNPLPSSNHPYNAKDYKYFKEITLDHMRVSGTENLIDYPLLISIFDSDLHDYTQTNGNDIAFSNNFQWLDHEIEVFNQTYNATHAQLVAWVRIPVLSPSEDTIIRMYFGNPYIGSRENPTGVWNSNYEAVWHMNQDPSSSNILDSTSNNNDLSPTGFASDQRIYNGKIGTAIAFDGIDDYLSIGTFSGPTDGFTFETWFKFDAEYTVGGNHMYLFSGNTPLYGNNLPRLRFYNGSAIGSVATAVDDNDSCHGTKNLWAPDTWFHYIFRFSVPIRTTTLYLNGTTIDGIKVDSDLDYPHSDWNSLSIASDYGTRVWGSGAISEFRVLKGPLSSDWIETEYNNQVEPSTFYSVSGIQVVNVPSILDFQYFKEITIDHTKVTGTNFLINFPILISIYDSDLHDEVQPDGDDIAFNNGTDWLHHEFEVFNQNFNSTHAQLITWVCIPRLSPFEDTIIRMYYGNSTMGSQENPQGVWDSNYVAVYHLNDNPTDLINDSTNKINLIGNNMDISDLVDGQIGYGFNFDSSDIEYLISTKPTTIQAFTFSLWANPELHPNWEVLINFDTEGSNFRYFAISDGNSIGYDGEGGLSYFGSGVPQNEWQFFGLTYDGSQMKAYRNGNQFGSSVSKTIQKRTDDFEIGSYHKGVELYDGQMDEVRISYIARSADWIKTEYNNQYNPNSFYSLGNETKVEDDKPYDDFYFRFYKNIKIDNQKVFGTGYHSNFPVLISLFDSDLHNDVQLDGDDIAFSLGSMWLDHEIQIFNQNHNGTHAQLVAWVRIPELSTSLDTYIRMYYGNSTMSSRENPTGVWDGSYKGVWHLEESSGFTQDSTSYNENGMVSGTVIRPSTGQIGNAYNYGTDGTFNVGDPADGHLDFTIESFMVSMWINIDTSTGTWQIPLYKGATSTWNPGYCFGTPTTGDSISFHITDGIDNIGSPDASITFDTWSYIVGIVDRTNDLIRIYKDGYEVGSGTDISTILSLADTQNIEFQCANPTYDFDGLLDEIRVLNITRSKYWIKTEYYNQYDPYSFYSIGEEQSPGGIMFSDLQVNAIDLSGNHIPSANISIYNQTTLIGSNLTDSNGNTVFMNLIQAEYNFTASITSDIGNYVEIVNITSEAILINQSFQIINLICNVSSNFFEIVDIDGVLLDSGWVIVGNSTHELQNCSIDSGGHARFWWVNMLPYQYNYSVYYQDNNYIPNIIKVASGDLTTPNSSIQVQASLTTVNFNILTLITKQPVDGVKLLLTSTTTGDSIVNLTTDNNGITTLRWLNSSGIYGNYSLQLEFFGALRNFNMTGITKTLITETNFTVSAAEDFYIYIEVSLENYKTELISLNPSEYISVQWGSQLKLRIMFNVSKAIGAEYLLGPTYSDIMRYEIFKGADFVQSGTFGFDNDYIGTHYSIINTESLESDITYIVFISAQKPGYSIPQELLLQLSILQNELILNQSQNDDSVQSVYWSDNIDFSVKAYGEISESFTTETSIFQDINNSFRFSLPDINVNWNLSKIIFNIYNISWNANASDINLSILDPYGINSIFNTSNHAGWDYNLGVWTGITLNVDKESPTYDNNFEFIISGTFNNTIDIIADAYFIRNDLNIQYAKFNISDTIALASESEGWVIKNITFIIQNCYNTATWQKVNLSTLTNLNISTADGFKYSLHSGDENGNGVLIIDDKIIYPLDNQYLFSVESNPNVIFDAIIKVEHIQVFYQNKHIETINISYVQENVPNGGTYQLSLTNDWDEKYAVLLISGINNKTKTFSPSEVAMNITIGGQTYTVVNTLPGQGIFSLNGFNKDSLYLASIETNQPVNFTLSFKISYLRTVTYAALGTVTYVIQGSPDIFGVVDYYPSLGEFLLSIDTSLVDADYYTIIFEVFKENYKITSKDLDFVIMNRLTLINGDSKIYRELEFIYVKDARNFTFLYTDALTGSRITDLTTQSFRWEKYDIDGNVTANGEGTLIQEDDGSLVLDFNSEIRAVGDYLLIVNLEKANYEYKIAMILLTIKTRFLSYSLGSNFKNYQISVVEGHTIPIQINLTDPTRGGIPLLNASVRLIIRDNIYQFNESSNGTYIFNYRTSNINAFFSSKTLTGIINITREDYFSEEFLITITVEMEEIFPGMPTFYFLLIIFAILATVGSIVGYRVYKYATIPTFVKNIRQMQKEIKSKRNISESLLYQTKEVFIGEIVKDRWSAIGLSLGDILGIEIRKSKKIHKLKKASSEGEHYLKPLGLILMKWDERIGAELISKYPENVNVSDKTLMQIYGAHEYSGERGLVSLIRGNLNVLSYYTGPESAYYIVLILSIDDDPDMYEGAMPNIAQLILQHLDEDYYLQMIPSLFQRLSVYPSLTEEQNLLYYYQDDIKRMVINILRDYGVITKSELTIWVKDSELEGIIDLEAILADLIKIELIKVTSVKGIPSELIFLTKDFFMLRVPPDT